MKQCFEELPWFLGEHLAISMLSLAVGISIALPTAVFLVRRKAMRWPVLAVAGIIQTVPSLAMLALFVFVGFDPGFSPAFIALTLYSILPVLRNTVTGILEVDPDMTEAARGIGMKPGQVLFKVEIPLAMPVIIAGIRTATVWVVGIATLSTPVGQPSLGNYIFSGLYNDNMTRVIFGCVCAAGLALLLDFFIGLIERGVRGHSRLKVTGALAGLILLVGGGITAPVLVRKGETGRGVVRIGAKTFTEQYILASVIEKQLENADYSVDKLESLGSNIVFQTLENGGIDCYVEYSGTIWANYMKRGDAASADEVLLETKTWLAEKKGIVCLGPLGFENTYTVVMRRKDAEERGIRTLDDLARAAPGMKLAYSIEFRDRPERKKMLNTYGLRFSEEIDMNPTLMYSALARGGVDAIVAFSSDGRIEAYNLVSLDDPKDAFPPYDAVLLLSKRAAERPGVEKALRPLIGAISMKDMRRANYMVSGEKKEPKEAAKWLFEQLPR
jgi:osmoprotectant transport system permease protein